MPSRLFAILVGAVLLLGLGPLILVGSPQRPMTAALPSPVRPRPVALPPPPADGPRPAPREKAPQTAATGSEGVAAAGPASALASPPPPRLVRRLPPPAPGDWRSSHPEAEQSLREFIASGYPRPGWAARRIDLVPLGEAPRRPKHDLAVLRGYTAVFFQLPVAIHRPLSVAGEGVTARINPFTRRPQLLADDLAKRLAAHRERRLRGSYVALGLTLTDLYPHPSWNYAFGVAYPQARVGVLSLARYDPAFYRGSVREIARLAAPPPDAGRAARLRLKRSLQVITHELGHLFGLDHCATYACLMNGGNSLDELDASPLLLCPDCLRKLHHSVRFELVKRDRALQRALRRLGFPAEARHVAARLAWLQGPPRPETAQGTRPGSP